MPRVPRKSTRSTSYVANQSLSGSFVANAIPLGDCTSACFIVSHATAGSAKGVLAAQESVDGTSWTAATNDADEPYQLNVKDNGQPYEFNLTGLCAPFIRLTYSSSTPSADACKITYSTKSLAEKGGAQLPRKATRSLSHITGQSLANNFFGPVIDLGDASSIMFSISHTTTGSVDGAFVLLSSVDGIVWSPALDETNTNYSITLADNFQPYEFNCDNISSRFVRLQWIVIVPSNDVCTIKFNTKKSS